MITLLEPPRPAGLTSGGFRYQERVVDALGGAARRLTVSPAHLATQAQALRGASPCEDIVVDGWFVDLSPDPLPPDVTPLLHMVPRTQAWSAGPRRAIATSQRTAAAVGDHFEQVAVVRPGVDECFTVRTRTGDATVSLICAGTISEAKGQRRLLAALRGVSSPWRLTLVGSLTGPPRELEAVHRAADGLPVTIRGPVSAEQLAELYAQHDLFVTLSSSESYGMAAAEAAAAGLPLLGADTGELRTFGVDEARWLVPVDASELEVRARLRELLADPDALRALRGRGTTPQRTWTHAAAEFAAALA